MPTCNLYNLQKKKVGTLELHDHIFAAPVKPQLFHEVTTWQLAIVLLLRNCASVA